MKLLFDFFPILLFFIAYKSAGIFAATQVAMAASVLQVAIHWFRTRKFETTHIISMVLIIVFGGATLYLQDPLFIKWKPTVLNWLFGTVFLGSHFIGDRTIIERMLGAQLQLPKHIWARLNLMWTTFFLIIGCVNIWVAYRFDEQTWVNFKLFGMLGLTVVFVLVQSVYLSRHMAEPKTEE